MAVDTHRPDSQFNQTRSAREQIEEQLGSYLEQIDHARLCYRVQENTRE